MKKLTLLTLIAFVSVSLPPFAFSQSVDEATQKRLDEIKNKLATSSSQTATDSTTQSGNEVSFIEGTISSINGTILMVSTSEGSRIIYTVDSTKFFSIDSSGKKISGFGDLKTNDRVMIIGLQSQSNSGTAKIIVRDTVAEIPTFSAIGNVGSVSDSTITLNTISRNDLPTLSLIISNDTAMKDNDNKDLLLPDLKTSDRIVAAGQIDGKGALITKTILKLSASSSTATPSAQ